MKKLLGILLCTLMLAGMLCMTVSAAKTGTKVSKFEPGDSGRMTLKSGYAGFYDPDNIKQGVGYSFYLDGNVTLEVVEAYVIPSNKAGTFHAVEYKGEIWFVKVTDFYEEFGDFVKYDNNPQRPYHNAHQASTDREVTSVSAYQLIAVEGQKPTLSYKGSAYGYHLEDIIYGNTGVSKAYTWETAVAVYKADEGFCFTEKNLFNGWKLGTEITMKLVDSHTIYAAFTSLATSERDNVITAAMEDYVERNKNAHSATPYVATAEVYNPNGENLLYPYPTMKMDALRNYPGRAQDKARVEILDMDLSDDIPDMVGEWYFVRLGHESIGFIPKAYLTNIQGVDYWAGSPGVSKQSTYKFAGGSGTETDPYLVATADQLNAIRQGLDKHYKLIADIDLSGWGNWTPIGGTPAYGGHRGDSANKAQHGADYFTGTIDGDGHVISGMQIVINEEKPYMFEKGNTRFYGFIAAMSSDKDTPTVRNLGIVNYKIDVNYNDLTGTTGGNYFFFGAIAGQSLTAHIENCWTSGGTMRFNTNKSDNLQIKVGGLIGEAHKVDITRCANASDIMMTCCNVSGNSFTAGGIIGQGIQADITECFNSGDITLPKFYDDATTDSYFYWADSCVGGIAGEIVAVHGVVGYTEESYFTDCYNSGNLSAQSADNIIVYVGTGAKVYVKNAYGVGTISYNTSDNTCSPEVIKLSLSKSTSFTNYASNGNSVSGTAWQYSSKLGRMVLVCHPEDSLAAPAASPFIEPFTDVMVDIWYGEPVRWAVARGITNGTSTTTFSPDNTCTKAQILTFLWRAAGSPAVYIENPFTNDFNGQEYYFKAIIWAYDKGMIPGGYFAPEAPCSRADTVMYLWKNAGSPSAAYSGNFSDVSAGASYAQAVAWAVNVGVTTGTSDVTFSPDNICTRGQIVTFLYRALGK